MSHLSIQGHQRVYYERIDGDPDRPWLVFLHEGLGCAAMWQDFPARLCRQTGCPGLIYDRQGYGRSAALTEKRTIHYLHEYGLNELPRVIAALIPGRDYILVGHSDGGSISLIYGAAKPRHLKGIVTAAAHVYVDDETIDGIRQADRAWRQGKLTGLARYHGDKTEGIFRAWADTWLSPWFRHWDIRYLLPSVDCPVLAIQGRDDHYGSPDQVEAIASGTSSDAASMLIDHCGHSPHLQVPEKMCDAIAEFVVRSSS